MFTIGTKVKIRPELEQTGAQVVKDYIRQLGDGWRDIVLTISTEPVGGSTMQRVEEHPGFMLMAEELVAVPIFATGARVRIKDNRQAIENCSINYDQFIIAISDNFTTIYTLSNRHSFTNGWDLNNFRYWLSEECLEIVENAPTSEIIPRFKVGDRVQILRNAEDLERVDTTIRQMDDYMDIDSEDADEEELEVYKHEYIVSRVNSDWIDLIGCSYSFKEFNLKLAMPTPAKKSTTKEKPKMILEEVEKMTAANAYSHFYDDVRRKVDKELYSIMKYELSHGKIKDKFRAKLQLLFRGTGSCEVQTHDHGKSIIINYLKYFDELKAEVEILKKITQLEEECKNKLSISFIEEQKKRTVLLINREKNLLFAEANENNCKEFLEAAHVYVKNIEILQTLFKEPQENYDKIKEILVELNKNEKILENYKVRFDLAYRADLKKLTVQKNRINLKHSIRSIESKNREINKMREEILDNLTAYDKDEQHQIYRTAKVFMNRVKHQKIS